MKHVLFTNEIKRRDTNYIINFNLYLLLQTKCVMVKK